MVFPIFLLIVSFILTIIFFFYGFNLYYMLFYSRRYKAFTLPLVAVSDRPNVAVHLPVYNEKYVVQKLISSCYQMAKTYGIEKVKVFIIDDSNDETVEEIDRLAEVYSHKGLVLEVMRRKDRTGFKAGALQTALEKTNEDYIAIFDADFAPSRNFLIETIPYFIDQPNLGVVQSRWEHLNRNYNALTRAISIGIDVHFLIEQPARYSLSCFQNFNGSGGVLKKEAIIKAGGWQSDTLAEDLDLSYRMQLTGYRILFLRDLTSSAEIPPTVTSFKRQQARWANGSLRTARKLLPSLILRRDLPLQTRFQGLLHLTNYMVHPLMFISFLLACTGVISGANIFRLPQASFVLAASETGVDLLYHISWITIGLLILLSTLAAWIAPVVALRKQNKPVLQNIPNLFVLFLLGCGLSLNNSIEAIKALFTKKIWAFQRTPKYSMKNHKDRWKNKSYQISFDYVILLELALVGLGIFAISSALTRSQPAVLVILIPYTLAYAYVFSLSLFQSSRKSG
jgi:cellulose synthase/poly-beta-1,6-N-acetylglucosamine synthase-like glycosyltransferase